jgi:hypothetical protein
MPKTFYTERDIEDLAKRGVISLVQDDDVVLTDLARDKALRLGIELLREQERPPSAPERPYITKFVSPSAIEAGEGKGSPRPLGPERPYITRMISPSAQEPALDTGTLRESTVPVPPPSAAKGSEDIQQQVKAEVIARLGEAVDAQLLDTIIQRVLQNVGVK